MKVAFIGAGVMGRAIAEGAATHQPGSWEFTFFDPNQAAAQSAAQAVGGRSAASAADAVAGAEMVVLAVKPQVQSRVINSLPKLDGQILVSIAAGRILADIGKDLSGSGQRDVPVVRVMPNVNAIVGHATTAVCGSADATDEQVAAVVTLFESVGTTMQIDEDLFGVFTAMAGSSPAWFFQIVDDLAHAGVKHGLTKEQATKAACSTMLGSAAMLAHTLEEGGHPAQLVDRVCSPGGTTIAGLLAAQAAGLGPALVDAVDAVVARDKELGHP